MHKWMLILPLSFLMVTGCGLIERPPAIVVITDTPVLPTHTPTLVPTETPTPSPTPLPTNTPVPTRTPTAIPQPTQTSPAGATIDPDLLVLTEDDLDGLFFPVSLEAFGIEEPLTVDGVTFDGAFVFTDPSLNFYLGFSNVITAPSEAEAFEEVMRRW